MYLKSFFIFLILLSSFSFSYSQIGFDSLSSGYTTIDIIKVKDSLFEESFFYYQNNWKEFRDSSIKLGLIEKYYFVRTQRDAAYTSDFALITVYKDSLNYLISEIYFRDFMKRKRPNGFLLLNKFTPSQFRTVVLSCIGFQPYYRLE